MLSDSADVMKTVAKQRFLRKSPFLEFCDAEGLPVITSYGVEDLRQNYLPTVPEREGGTVMDYEDEPREVRTIYETELAKSGVPCRMPPVIYRNS